MTFVTQKCEHVLNIVLMTKGQDLSGEGLAYSKGNRFSIYFKGNTLEMLQKARAGEAPVTYDVTPCDKMSQKSKKR